MKKPSLSRQLDHAAAGSHLVSDTGMDVPSKSSMILPTRCSEAGMNLAALASALASAHMLLLQHSPGDTAAQRRKQALH